MSTETAVLAPAKIPFSELPEGIESICATASDPLEIVAELEARGVSSRVAIERFGVPDVFTLARQMFEAVPAAPRASVGDLRPQRFGRPGELLRGAMFAAPAVFFGAAIKGLRLHLPAWPYLVALTLGWALGQGVVSIGSALAGRGVRLNALSLWWLVAAAGVTAALAVAFNHTAEGGGAAIALSVVVTLYVIACGILLHGERTWSMAVPLLLATVLAIGYLLHKTQFVPEPAVTVDGIGCAIGLTLLLAVRDSWRHPLRVPKLTASDLATGARYLVHGMFCGLATSLVIVLGTAPHTHSTVISFASYPILASLGVMEWQLYSFRARARRALHNTSTLAAFRRSASRAFALSLAFYLVALGACCAGIGYYLHWRGQPVPVTLLVAELVLGGAFFAGLVATSCRDISVVLGADVIAALVFGGFFAYTHFTHGVFDQTNARIACLTAFATAFAVVVVVAQRPIRSAFSFQ